MELFPGFPLDPWYDRTGDVGRRRPGLTGAVPSIRTKQH